MDIAGVQQRFERLLEVVDSVLTAHDTPPFGTNSMRSPIRHADWAYQRAVAAGVMVRGSSGGAAPAVLARGLLEEAAYFDWALATGQSSTWVNRLAHSEYNRLRSRADAEDNIWFDWVLPPETSIVSDGGGVPNSSDVVKRLGHGFTAELLEPLSIEGLYGVYKLVELVTHGSAATALLFDQDDGCEMSEPLAAAVLHLAGAGVGAAVVSWLRCTVSQVSDVAVACQELADAACRVHRFPLGPRLQRKPAKASKGPPDFGANESRISNLPPPPAALMTAAFEYVEAANAAAFVLASLPQHPPTTGLERLARSTLDLADAHLRVLQGIVEGTLGRAFLPVAARSLFEDGARWGWLGHAVSMSGPTGSSLESLLADAKRHTTRTREWMIAEHLPLQAITQILSPAAPLLEATIAEQPIPTIEQMIELTYHTDSSTPWALPAYGLLSQFAHYSPIAAMHVQRDTFPSLSAPMFAVSVQAACQGHWYVTARASSIVYDKTADGAAASLTRLATAAARVSRLASGRHFLD